MDAHDPELLARFRCEVLGYVELERDEESIEIGQTGAESWQVLADPEGNEFCLLGRRVPGV